MAAVTGTALPLYSDSASSVSTTEDSVTAVTGAPQPELVAVSPNHDKARLIRKFSLSARFHSKYYEYHLIYQSMIL